MLITVQIHTLLFNCVVLEQNQSEMEVLEATTHVNLWAMHMSGNSTHIGDKDNIMSLKV